MDQLVFASKPESLSGLWDVVVVGSGPAGLTAAIYTTRGAASTVIVGGETWGGQLMLTTGVDNFPSQPGIMGPDLMFKMKEHAQMFGAEFIQQNVTEADFSVYPFKLKAGVDWLSAKSVVIASGAQTKWLDIPNLSKLIGRGVSSCAPCDAPFFKDKKVIVVGGGDSAMEESLVLSKYALDVTIIHRRGEFRASRIMQEKVFANSKINVIWNSEVVEVAGDDKLRAVTIKNVKTGRETTLNADGLFVAIGHIPSSEVFRSQIETDEKGFIKKYERDGFKMATSVDGVFVAGDVHDYNYKQAITAAGFGCMAAMDALNYLVDNKQD